MSRSYGQSATIFHNSVWEIFLNEGGKEKRGKAREGGKVKFGGIFLATSVFLTNPYYMFMNFTQNV